MKLDIFKKLIEKALGTPVITEFKFHPGRKWRADYAIPEYKIIIEVEGGAWIGGRHTSGAGFVKDMEKYNSAASMGYSVLRTEPKNLKSKEFITTVIETALNK